MGVSRCQSCRHRLTPHTSHQTIQYSDKMFIEDEADAVFNEIRQQKKDDKGEEITTSDQMTPAATETKAASPAPAAAPMISIKVDVLNRAVEQEKQTSADGGGDEEIDDVELEEPVSPPACHPSEGPPLLFSHSIEDLAAVIVKEKRQNEDEDDDVPKRGEKRWMVASASTSKAVPALIPLTVSEFGERPSSINSPSTLHMSGGGVYTTDSYYRKLGPPITSTTSSGSRLPAPAAPQLSVIKKLPVSTAAPMPAKKKERHQE